MKPMATDSGSRIRYKACGQTSVEQKQPLQTRRIYRRRSARRETRVSGPPRVLLMMMMTMIISIVASHASLSHPPGVLDQILDDALKGLLVAQGVVSPAEPEVQRLPRLRSQRLELLHVLS